MLVLASATPALAAPVAGLEFDGGGATEHNYVAIGDTERVAVWFTNTAEGYGGVASTLQYVTVAAANMDPSRFEILPEAEWAIFDPEGAVRASGSVTGVVDTAAIFAPYSSTDPLTLVTWSLGPPSPGMDYFSSPSQFTGSLRVLQSHERLRMIVAFRCLGPGVSNVRLFFPATEHHPASPPVPDFYSIPPEERVNLFYSKRAGRDPTLYWWPLYRSYDPYDASLSKGHAFNETSWTAIPTLRAYEKADKVLHQADVNPGVAVSGYKYEDLDSDGELDYGEPGLEGFRVTLLGADGATPAEQYYNGTLTPVPGYANPAATVEGGYYSFHLLARGGVYTLFLRLAEEPGWVSTTGTTLGPLTLRVFNEREQRSEGNNFGDATSAAHQRIRVAGAAYHDAAPDAEMSEEESGLDGCTVTLLGADAATPAEQYYPGAFTLGGNPQATGSQGAQGGYSFTLSHALPRDYTFYVRSSAKPGWASTTPSLQGPFTIQAGVTGVPTGVTGVNFGYYPALSGEVEPCSTQPLRVSDVGLLLLSMLAACLAARRRAL